MLQFFRNLWQSKLTRRMVLRALILGLVTVGGLYYLSPRLKTAQMPENADVASQSMLFTIMSTTASIDLYSRNRSADFNLAFQSAREELKRVSALCNRFDPESELSRLNRTAAAEPFVCSPELWFILTEARKYYELSGGAFDISVTPLIELWKSAAKKKVLPTGQELEAARKLTGLSKVIFDDTARSVRFPSAGMQLDLGGIAKGWALDRAVLALKNAGFTMGFVDLGGNVRTLSEPPPGYQKYRSGIRDPFDKSRIGGRVSLQPGQAIATSGSYERFVEINGKHYSHIIDPATGCPVETKIMSATVIAPDGVTSDALSTAFFLRGPGFAEQVAERIPGLRYLIVSDHPDGKGEYEIFSEKGDWECDFLQKKQ